MVKHVTTALSINIIEGSISYSPVLVGVLVGGVFYVYFSPFKKSYFYKLIPEIFLVPRYL